MCEVSHYLAHLASVAIRWIIRAAFYDSVLKDADYSVTLNTIACKILLLHYRPSFRDIDLWIDTGVSTLALGDSRNHSILSVLDVKANCRPEWVTIAKRIIPEGGRQEAL